MKLKLTCLWFTVILISSIFTVFPAIVMGQVSSSSTFSQDVFALQATATPTSSLRATLTPTLPLSTADLSTFNITLNELGYGENTLNGPIGRAGFELKLPSHWQIQEGSFIEFDLSYKFSSLSASADLPTTFGDLRVVIDGQTATIFTIEEIELNHFLLRVPLPLASFVGDNAQTRHIISLNFDTRALCITPNKTTLVVHPSSYFSLNYTLSPLAVDLSTYPSPFYQDSFTPDEITFSLPAQPSPSEAAGAMSVAAKLGQLTGNQIVISSTVNSDLIKILSSPESTFNQHLIVIGQPQQNELLSLLNEKANLPVAWRERQMGLATQGPVQVSPGQIFTYTFTVTNTSNNSTTLSLVDTLPLAAQLVQCDPQCSEDATTSLITWANTPFDPAEVKNFSLVLTATDRITSNISLENTVTLFETDLGPINVDTFVSEISFDDIDNGEQQTSKINKSDYFFIIGDKAVAENDGIIQEIVSPWDENRAILIITGLNDEAIRKASQAMSSELRFPGMRGPVALVQDAFPLELIEAVLPPTEITFQDLGYNNEITQGLLTQQINYSFFLPPDWRLTDRAFVDLHFTHAQAIGDKSGLTVLLNNTPIATIMLDETTASNGRLQAALPASAARPGQVNRLTLRVSPFEVEGCTRQDQFREFWFVANRKSRLFLDHSQNLNDSMDLAIYPYPFSNEQSLTDLLFVLPDKLITSDWENLLRLAAALGNSAGGETILPRVVLGNNLPEDSLTNYHIIAFGRPSQNLLIQQVSSELPQPFLPQSDEIQQKINNVVFRLLPGIDLGYLQLIPSPWNTKRALLVITGTTDQGVSWATRALITRNLAQQLKGNLALLQDLKINTLDTRKLIKSNVPVAIATIVPELTTTTTVTDSSSSVASMPVEPTVAPINRPTLSDIDTPHSPPGWIILIVVMTTLLVIAILAIAFMQARRRRQT